MRDFTLIKEYIQGLIGTPYVWWKESDVISSAPPFWAEDSVAPSSEHVQKSGINCAGFLNLVCRFADMYIPGVSLGLEYAGGTYVWYTQLEQRGLLEPFKNDGTYSPGTLLLRNYTDESNQGHVAIVLENGTLAHCYPGVGVAIDESYFISHNWFASGYYTDVCLPQNWLYNPSLQR
jgi:cell wall-associated NlpC family hydrolase